MDALTRENIGCGEDFSGRVRRVTRGRISRC
jgi:hypothetical protein